MKHILIIVLGIKLACQLTTFTKWQKGIDIIPYINKTKMMNDLGFRFYHQIPFTYPSIGRAKCHLYFVFRNKINVTKVCWKAIGCTLSVHIVCQATQNRELGIRRNLTGLTLDWWKIKFHKISWARYSVRSNG